jgi:hypothetical protein
MMVMNIASGCFKRDRHDDACFRREKGSEDCSTRSIEQRKRDSPRLSPRTAEPKVAGQSCRPPGNFAALAATAGVLTLSRPNHHAPASLRGIGEL